MSGVLAHELWNFVLVEALPDGEIDPQGSGVVAFEGGGFGGDFCFGLV